MKANTLIKLKKYIGTRNVQKTHFKTLKKEIYQTLEIIVTAKELFDALYPDEIIQCNNAKFVSWGVGYSSCRKGCDCYVKNLSQKISKIKDSYTDEKKESILSLRKETVLSKYGVENVFQLNNVKQKSKGTKLAKYSNENYNNREQCKETVLSKYGVENVMQLDTIILKNHENRDYYEANQVGKQTKLAKYGNENYNNREQCKETVLSKYGVENVSQDAKIRNKISNNLKSKLHKKYIPIYESRFNIEIIDHYEPCKELTILCKSCNNIFISYFINGTMKLCKECFPPFVSKDELNLRKYLELYNIDMEFNDRKILKGKELDILIPSKNIAFEYNGLYWHSDFHKDKWYHYNKTKDANKAGIKLIQIFSHLWYSKPDIIKSRIKQIIGINSKRLYARKCYVKVIDNKIASFFLETNHLSGYANSKVKLGLFTDNKLVSVMSFGKNRFEKTGWEMIRYATAMNLTVVGGASKLFKHFVNNFSPEKITTFSDNTFGYTDFYSNLGFELISNGVPGYFYINRNKNAHDIISRMQVQKHKLVKQGYNKDLTESQIMSNRGFSKVYDCGHSKWVWDRDKIGIK